MTEAKEKMEDNEKKYYKIGEVSAMLDVPISTLRFWEDTFEQLDPFRTPGGTRKYRPEDVEMCKLIKHLLRDKGLSLEYTKKELAGLNIVPQLHAPDKCKSAKGAIRLLTEAERRIDDASAKIRVEYVLEWLREKEAKPHKNIRGKEYFAKSLAGSENQS